MDEERLEDPDDDIMVLGLELSDRETFSIGRIVALWGSLEFEIFCQMLDCLNPASLDELPREMNNLQPSLVLELWKKHVVDAATDKRKEVLQQQYQKISRLADVRHAIVHGMWDWSAEAPEKIIVMRVRKDKLHNLQLTMDDLEHISLELAKINFRIRYPGGSGDYAREMSKQGFYVSRRFVALATNNPAADDWFPFGQGQVPEPSSE
jgi:hypothetical protein